MASLNSIYERLGSIRMTEAQRREAEGALMWGEVIADLIHRAASVVRRTVARVAQGIRGLIDGLLRASTGPEQGDSENLAGRSVYGASHMDENVKKFMIASAAALSVDWLLRDGKTARAAEMLFQPQAIDKRARHRINGGKAVRERGDQPTCNWRRLK